GEVADRRLGEPGRRRAERSRSGVSGGRGGEPLQFLFLSEGGDGLRRVRVALRRANLIQLVRVRSDNPPTGFQETVQLALAQDGGAGEGDVGLPMLASLRQHPAGFDPCPWVIALELLRTQ